ncbi:selenocysteine-specific translation elongation factor [Micrococcoides hystricis]|uniref:Selenocysteine-specific elongation factor n=1 Tax=Micrococcoides hystricis TaxID=1572761 RepID=A0ABV6PD08_9MICC
MFVVATAGHVDHGKSTLVNALTGMEPDRWEEEKRRGLTIDLGFAWTKLPSGREVSFVDVPGHERFLTNMVAGVGPAPVVCFVVAADQGWQEQSTDHFDAIGALGIEHGIIALTRCDLATEALETITANIRERIHGTALANAPIVPVSARTGEGITDLKTALDDALAQVPAPDPAARLRMWIDRAFSITGAGTVVTGTLAAGTLSVGDELTVQSPEGPITAVIRGLQSRNQSVNRAAPANRVAVNLRGVPTESVHRGDALTRADQWVLADEFDARQLHFSTRSVEQTTKLDQLPDEVMLHIGTACVHGHLRGFDTEHARLKLAHPLPLQVGDRLILRVPGSELPITGLEILDLDPPELTRRGAGKARQAELVALPSGGDALAHVRRRNRVSVAELQRQGLQIPTELPADIVLLGAAASAELVDRAALKTWASLLDEALQAQAAADPLSPWLTRTRASHVTGVDSGAVLDAIITASSAVLEQGKLRHRDATPSLGTAEASVAQLEARLATEPFAAPEADELAALNLGAKELAAATEQGRLLRLADGIVLLPKAPAMAMRELVQLEQPFTTSAARQALGTTRRVAIPLLEYLDSRGWTRQESPGKRVVVR